ncbi:hypothetical protein VDGL01_00375 [Verticillium dahliae]
MVPARRRLRGFSASVLQCFSASARPKCPECPKLTPPFVPEAGVPVRVAPDEGTSHGLPIRITGGITPSWYQTSWEQEGGRRWAPSHLGPPLKGIGHHDGLSLLLRLLVPPKIRHGSLAGSGRLWLSGCLSVCLLNHESFPVSPLSLQRSSSRARMLIPPLAAPSIHSTHSIHPHGPPTPPQSPLFGVAFPLSGCSFPKPLWLLFLLASVFPFHSPTLPSSPRTSRHQAASLLRTVYEHSSRTREEKRRYDKTGRDDKRRDEPNAQNLASLAAVQTFEWTTKTTRAPAKLSRLPPSFRASSPALLCCEI